MERENFWFPKTSPNSAVAGKLNRPPPLPPDPPDPRHFPPLTFPPLTPLIKVYAPTKLSSTVGSRLFSSLPIVSSSQVGLTSILSPTTLASTIVNQIQPQTIPDLKTDNPRSTLSTVATVHEQSPTSPKRILGEFTCR